MVKGLIAQFTARVMPIPRQCRATWPKAAKSIFTSMGMIISQIRMATGRLTLASSMALTALNRPGMSWPSAMPATMQRKTQTVR